RSAATAGPFTNGKSEPGALRRSACHRVQRSTRLSLNGITAEPSLISPSRLTSAAAPRRQALCHGIPSARLEPALLRLDQPGRVTRWRACTLTFCPHACYHLALLNGFRARCMDARMRDMSSVDVDRAEHHTRLADHGTAQHAVDEEVVDVVSDRIRMR